MFESCSNKGFRITFANGYALSVQWGPMNYCTNRNTDTNWDTNWDIAMSAKDGLWESDTAEVAVFDPDDKLIDMAYDQVHGHVHADEIVDLMALVAEGDENAIEVYFKTEENVRA
jgi:squalene cyclase